MSGMGQQNKKAWFLLLTYLMVVLSTIGANRLYADSFLQQALHLDDHEIHHGVQERLTYHGGIFHYLGHILEHIITTDVDAGEHFSNNLCLERANKPSLLLHKLYQSYIRQCNDEEIAKYVRYLPHVDILAVQNHQCPALPLRAPPYLF